MKREKTIDQVISKSSSGIPLIVVLKYASELTESCPCHAVNAHSLMHSRRSCQLLSSTVFTRSTERRRYVEKTKAQITDNSKLI